MRTRTTLAIMHDFLIDDFCSRSLMLLHAVSRLRSQHFVVCLKDIKEKVLEKEMVFITLEGLPSV